MMESNLLQEIEEDLQRQRFEALWKRYGKHVIGLVLLIVLTTAAVTGYRSWRTRTEQSASTGLLAILDANDPDKTKEIAALEDFAREHPSANQAIIARLHAASLAFKDGKKDKALALYDAIANDASIEPAFRQLADLYAVQAQLDTGDPAALQARLQPLLTDSPYRYSAKEFSALLALRAGDKAKAKQFYQELLQESDVPKSITERAQDMLRWLGGGE
jgi:hypothetical protein